MKNFFAIWIILVSFVFGGICMKVIELVNQRHNIKSIFKMQERAVEMEEGGYSKTTGKFYLKSYK